MDQHTMPESLRQLVEGELASGERIQWMAQPQPRGGFPWAALPMMLFAIPWTGFALFWMANAAGVVGGNAPFDAGRLVFALFGLPFVLIGLAMLTAPYWIKRRLSRTAAKTIYLITDRRAVIFDGGYYGDGFAASMLSSAMRMRGKGTLIHSYTPNKFGPIQRLQRDDGSGDLIFGEELFSPMQQGYRTTITRAGFYSIPDVKEADRLLTALNQAATSTGAPEHRPA
jgi:hypothetical protein